MRIVDFIRKYKEETIHTQKYSNTQLAILYKKGMRTTEEVEERRTLYKKNGVKKKLYTLDDKELDIDEIYELHKQSSSSPYSIERVRQLINEWGDVKRVIRLNKPTLTLTEEQYKHYLKHRETKDKPLTYESAIYRVYKYWLDSLYNEDRSYMLKTKHKKTTSEDRKAQLIRWAKIYFNNWSSARIVASHIWITTNQLRYAIAFYEKNKIN